LHTQQKYSLELQRFWFVHFLELIRVPSLDDGMVAAALTDATDGGSGVVVSVPTTVYSQGMS